MTRRIMLRCGYNLAKLFSLTVLSSPCVLVIYARPRAYFARETESATGVRFPLFTAKLDISVGGEYMVEGSLENADIWRAIKAGQG